MPGLDEVRAAACRIEAIARHTPVMTSRSFDERCGVRTWFKCENLQRGGAFKIRGAANFLLSLEPEKRAKGVVAFSSGNHAQAVAIAAGQLGAAATIVMPADAPAAKLEATRGYGAEVVIYDRMTQDREAIGRRIATEQGRTLVPPFNHPWIIAGQGTVALELLDQAPDADALVVCISGGGLIAGCAIVAKALRPGMRVIGVEPQAANDAWQSKRAGHIVEIAPPETVADGLRAPRIGDLTFPFIRDLVDEIVLVTEEEILETMRFLLTRMKILVEPSGAVAAAAVLYGKLPGVKSAAVVLSGGNADLAVLGS